MFPERRRCDRRPGSVAAVVWSYEVTACYRWWHHPPSPTGSQLKPRHDGVGSWRPEAECRSSGKVATSPAL